MEITAIIPIRCAASNGRGIVSANVMYSLSPNNSVPPPDNTYVYDTVEGITRTKNNMNLVVWSATVVTYSDETEEVAGAHSLGVKLKELVGGTEQYALGSSNTTAPTDGWNTTYMPTRGMWLWTRTRYLINSGSYLVDTPRCVGYFGEDGNNGAAAVTYRLLPSTDVISFARQSDGTLAPESVSVYCGYQKNDGGTITNYPGNIVGNLSENSQNPYSIAYRYKNGESTPGEWRWAAQLTNGTLSVESSTSYTAVEYALTSADSAVDIDNGNTIDIKTISILKDGVNGADGYDAFEVSVSNSPIIFATNNTGAVNYTGNTCAITAKYKGQTAKLRFVEWGTMKNVQSNKMSATTGTVTSLAVTFASGSIMTKATQTFKDYNSSNGTYTTQTMTIPYTDGYVQAKVELSHADAPQTVQKTITIPYHVDITVHLSQFYHNDNEFVSRFTAVDDTLSGYGTTLTQHSTEIQQNAHEIELKAEQTDLDTLETRVGNVEVTAGQISAKVGVRNGGGGKNLVVGSKMNRVDYRYGQRTGSVDLVQGHTYVLSARGIITQALHDSIRCTSIGNSAQNGRLMVNVSDIPWTQEADANITTYADYSVGYAWLVANNTKTYNINSYAYPRKIYNTNDDAATPEQHYHLDWVQVEDVTEKLPANWASLNAVQKKDLLPQLASPWAVSDLEPASWANILAMQTAQFVDPNEDETDVYQKGTEVTPGGLESSYFCNTYAAVMDFFYDITAGLLPNKSYTLSFWAKSEGDTGRVISQVCCADPSHAAPVLGVYSDTAYKVEGSTSERFHCYGTGTAEVQHNLTSEWKKCRMTFTLARAATPAQPIRVIVARSTGSKFRIAGWKLEAGGRDTRETDNVTGDILDTGIDIVNRQIILTADNTIFRDNRGNETAAINNQGIISNAVICRTSSGVKVSSVNENNDGSFIQYYPSGKKMMEFGNGAITYYNDDEDNTIKWRIGSKGPNDMSADWIPSYVYPFYTTNKNGNYVTEVNCYIYRAGTGDPDEQYNGRYYTTNTSPNPSAGTIIDGGNTWEYIMNKNYSLVFVKEGCDAYIGYTKVVFQRPYAKITNGIVGSLHYFYYDESYNCVGNSEEDHVLMVPNGSGALLE